METEGNVKKATWSIRLGRGRSYVKHPEEYESVDGRLIPKEPLASIIRDTFVLFDHGHGIASIGRMLERRYKTTINRHNLHKKLRNPFYAGYVSYGDDIFYHHEPRLVEYDMYQRCALRLDGNDANNSKNMYAFSRLVFCDYDDCTRMMTGSAHRSRQRKDLWRVYYVCNDTKNIGRRFHPTNSVSEVEVMRELAKVVNLMAKNISTMNPEQPITIEDYTHNLVHKFKEILHTDNAKLVNEITHLVFKSIYVIDKRVTYSLHEPFKSIYLGKPIDAYSYPLEVIKYISGKKTQNTGALTGVLEDDILIACGEPRLLEEIAEYTKRPEKEIDAVMFDLQLAGKIEQDAFGRYKTI
jgi:hypothetical protein